MMRLPKRKYLKECGSTVKVEELTSTTVLIVGVKECGYSDNVYDAVVQRQA